MIDIHLDGVFSNHVFLREIPNATTKRARFMNNILPLFYKSMYPVCKNAREFVKRFHNEGRHEYDAECGVERLEKRIDVVMDPNNPAVAHALT